jgi:hypothetical protein
MKNHNPAKRTFPVWMALAACAGVLAGCSKSGPSGTETSLPATQPQTSSPTPGVISEASALEPAAPPAVTTNAASADPPADASAGPSLGALTREFQAAASFDDRFDAALRIGALGTAEAITTLEQLFRQEKDQELRVELINALIGCSGFKTERLRFLKLGVDRDQPAEVREAAIDGLVDLQDASALPVLEALFTDPDAAVAALARQSHELLRKILEP